MPRQGKRLQSRSPLSTRRCYGRQWCMNSLPKWSCGREELSKLLYYIGIWLNLCNIITTAPFCRTENCMHAYPRKTYDGYHGETTITTWGLPSYLGQYASSERQALSLRIDLLRMVVLHRGRERPIWRTSWSLQLLRQVACIPAQLLLIANCC